MMYISTAGGGEGAEEPGQIYCSISRGGEGGGARREWALKVRKPQRSSVILKETEK